MKILLTGSSGMLGKAIIKQNSAMKSPLDLLCVSSKECDLTNQLEVANLFKDNQFDLVIHAAAKIGGIQANIKQPIKFLVENSYINLNVIYEALRSNVNKFIFVGSACMYPKDYNTALKEEFILNAPLEPTNECYALSKITGAKLCQYISDTTNKYYRTIIPCNLYGPNDNFSESSSHLIGAIIGKMGKAKASNLDEVVIWGDGSASREILYVEDLADFIIYAVNNVERLPHYINIGTGIDYTVNDYYRMVAEIIGYKGQFKYDLSKPVGMQRKLLDITKLEKLGWKTKTEVKTGLIKTINWFNENYDILSVSN